MKSYTDLKNQNRGKANRNAYSRAIANTIISQRKNNDHQSCGICDNCPKAIIQPKLVGAIQKSPQVQKAAQFKEMIHNSSFMVAQRKQMSKLFSETAQRQEIEEEELLQGKFEPVQKQENKTGMPHEIKTKMEKAFNTDFSNVKLHPNSNRATEVGALAYTQGSDVHFAPGQFSPSTSTGQRLLGHELAHVMQQRQGRVQATTEVAGLPVNDSPWLEKEADVMGQKARI